jgi:hypothetical protein
MTPFGGECDTEQVQRSLVAQSSGSENVHTDSSFVSRTFPAVPRTPQHTLFAPRAASVPEETAAG